MLEIPFFLLAGALVRVCAEQRPPPLSISCLDVGPVFNKEDTENNISCLWVSVPELRYQPAAWVAPEMVAGPGPKCKWDVCGTGLYPSSVWSAAMSFPLNSYPCALEVKCTTNACALPTCSHLLFVVRFTKQDLLFFQIRPPGSNVFLLQEIQFGWCARLRVTGQSYLLTRLKNDPPVEVLESETTEASPEQLPIPHRLEQCAPYWFYRVDTRYTQLGSHVARLVLQESETVPQTLEVFVLPGFLNIFTANSRPLLPADSALSVSWTLTPLGGRSLAYQLFDHKNLGGWVPTLDPHAARSDLCFAAEPPAGSSLVDRLIFLLVNQSVDEEQLGRLELASGKVLLKVNQDTRSISLVQPYYKPHSFYFTGGYYFSSKELNHLTKHYIFFQRQGPSYLFQVDFKGGALATFCVYLHMNSKWTYMPLSDMDLKIHLFNSGPSDRFTLIYVIWFILRQHPFVQCQWTFVLEFYSAKKANLISNSTYTYKNGIQDAAKYIPKSVLPFNPTQYQGFVATVNCTRSGQNPIVLKTFVGTYASKIVESVVECYRLPCVFKQFSIQKPPDLLPVITMAKGAGLTLYATLQINCPAAEYVTLLWKIYQLSSKTDVPRWDIDLKVPAISPINKCYLVIPSFTLNFGIYLFNVSVTISTTDENDPMLYESDSVIVEVKQRALQARIDGGSSRSVGFPDSWTLKGTHSADPDSHDPLDGISFKWFCTQIESDYATMRLSQHAACSPLQTDLTWIDPSSPIQTVAPETLEANKQYHFRLVITKGGRRAYADQSVSIVPETVPKLTVECIENCGEVLMPTVRFSLTTKCLDCVTDARRSQYEWLLYLNGLTEVTFDWQKHSSTGRFKPYLSIDALSFLNTAGKNYTILLKFTTASVVTASVGYSFFVHGPPHIGNCSLTPNQGTSLVTLFVVHCSGFSKEYPPLVYTVIAASRKQSTISSLREDELGIIVYSGYDCVSLPFYLPIGDASENYRLPIYVVVYDSLGSFSQAILFATVTDISSSIPGKKVLDELVMLTSGSHAPMSVYLEIGDYLNAGSLLYTIASVLNDDISSAATDLLRDRTRLRESILNLSASITPVDVSAVNQIVRVITEVTNNSNELSLKSQQLALEKLTEVVQVLIKLREETILSEKAEQMSSGILTGLSNVMIAALLTVDKGNVGVISPEKISVFKQILSVLETVSELVMVGNVPEGDATLMQSDSWNIHLKKEEMWAIDSTFITQSGCKNCFHPIFTSAIQGLNARSIVSTTFYEFQENPLPWLENGRDIQTIVTGFQMTAYTEKGDPIYLIPDIADIVIAIKNETLVVSVPVSIGPDTDQTGVTSGEIGFEYDMTRAPQLLVQLFTRENISFNVSFHLGYNSSGSPPVATYQTVERPTVTKNKKIYIVLGVWAKKQDAVDRISKDQVVILPDNDPFDKECYLVTVYTVYMLSNQHAVSYTDR
ncbi:hypothetical protein NDU88_006125 [Pleurodeles waltl]|uniref:REJ domain-containing protein n=1 Tax=Pleurodeles waltl TaxID=8319 RepID=A0AAV7SNS0_PLEWA|nr:hypothetical protein NDU88_006125 [Pleurodeles waltl]